MKSSSPSDKQRLTDEQLANALEAEAYRLEHRCDANENFAIGKPFASTLMFEMREAAKRLRAPPPSVAASGETPRTDGCAVTLAKMGVDPSSAMLELARQLERELAELREAKLDEGLERIMAATDDQISAALRLEGRDSKDVATIARQAAELAILKTSPSATRQKVLSDMRIRSLAETLRNPNRGQVETLLRRALKEQASVCDAPSTRPTAGAYRWIEDAVKLLKEVGNPTYTAEQEKEWYAQRDTMLSGVPCPQVDLGFDSPADRAARAPAVPEPAPSADAKDAARWRAYKGHLAATSRIKPSALDDAADRIIAAAVAEVRESGK